MRDNTIDALKKGRLKFPHALGYKGSWHSKKTHCPKGHPLFGENLLITSRGARNCKICSKQYKIKWQNKSRIAQQALNPKEES